jgi:hypothetical protein
MKINQTLSTTLTILITLLVSFLFIKHCTPNNTITVNGEPTVTTTVEYIEIKSVDTSYIPKWDTLLKVDSIPTLIDTMAILKDYYSKYVYSDTIFIDTFGYAIIKDTITENKISSRIVSKDIKIPITTIEKIYYVNKAEIFYGPTVSTDLNVHLNVMYKSKNKNAYIMGIGLNNNIKPTLNVGVLWKLNKK